MEKKKPSASIYTAFRIRRKLRDKAQKKAVKESRSLSGYVKSLIIKDLRASGMITQEEEATYLAQDRAQDKK